MTVILEQYLKNSPRPRKKVLYKCLDYILKPPTHERFLDENAFLYGFVIPTLCLLVMIVLYLARSAVVIRYTVSMQVDKKVRDKMRRKRNLQLCLFVKVTLLVSSVAAFGALFKLTGINAFWIAFNVGHGLQGIAVALCVTCNCQVRFDTSSHVIHTGSPPVRHHRGIMRHLQLPGTQDLHEVPSQKETCAVRNPLWWLLRSRCTLRTVQINQPPDAHLGPDARRNTDLAGHGRKNVSGSVPAMRVAMGKKDVPAAGVVVGKKDVPATRVTVEKKDVPATRVTVGKKDVPATRVAVGKKDVPATRVAVGKKDVPATRVAVGKKDQGFGTSMAPTSVNDVISKPLDKRIGGTRKSGIEGLRQSPEVVLDGRHIQVVMQSLIPDIPRCAHNDPQTHALESLHPPHIRVRQVAPSGTRNCLTKYGHVMRGKEGRGKVGILEKELPRKSARAAELVARGIEQTAIRSFINIE
uniref:G-protein coupled receptors family 2 profile 2 domain-containing protein n=1 Tax=Timema monikensis TaxID=170555 RepID=A0A7R9HQJ6_9NEOP|nr:unnamed protein product [Timema monikensis]